MPAETSEQELELRDYLGVIRRRKLTLLGAVVVVLAGAVVASLVQTPVYAATAEVLLQPRSTESLFNPATGQRVDPVRALQTEIRVLESQPVKTAVRQKLGYAAEVSATPAGQTDVILVRAEDPDPGRAADVANAYAREYIDFRRRQAVDDLLAAAGEVQTKIDDLQRQADAAAPPARDALVQQQALFKNKLDQLQVDSTLKTGGAQLVTPAEAPTSPVRPKPLRNAVLALVLGSFFGLGLVFLMEYLDDSIKTKDDLERAAPGLPVLSLVPAVTAWKTREEPRVVTLSDSASPAAEAYRTLRTAIQFLGVDRPVQSVQVTSPGAQEGKTTTLANLGVAFARAGQPTAIVCTDLRRPRVHEFFGLSNAVGLTSVLLGEVPLARALQPVPGADRLRLLASGPLPPNPSELLQAMRTAEVLDALMQEGYLLLVDSPPVLPVSDALVVSGRVQGTLVVCSAGTTSRKELARTLELLSQVDAPVIGAVLNGVKAEDGYGYAYGYGYYGPGSRGAPANGNGAAAAVWGGRLLARRRSPTN